MAIAEINKLKNPESSPGFLYPVTNGVNIHSRAY